MTDVQPEPIASPLRQCCSETLKAGPIGFGWAEACSRARAGEFGGECRAIFTDRIEFDTTGKMLAEALAQEGLT
ncbi:MULTISPECIES: hypothetical protein [Sphingomonadaceae]|uniref:hypothetical protein n=1 Tax=Sphingomonadales TaxID=204457 RepID=UPI000832AEFB|nr:hypothetical protein [Sphingobium sp. TKS]MCF8709107.1 hypothetical protein [Rhizorhapis sp. SPR117]